MPLFTSETFKTKESMKVFNKKDLLCVYWVANCHKDFHLLMEDKEIFMKGDVKAWKKQFNSEQLQILESNNCENTCIFNNRTFYGMTLQWMKDGETLEISDPFSLLVMGRMVNGITYWFTIKKNRDMIYEYITK